MSRFNKIMLLQALFVGGLSAEQLNMYSDNEIRKMANAYVTMVEQPSGFNVADNIDYIFESSEFKGYVTGVLESTQMFQECGHRKTIKEIVYKTAKAIGGLNEQAQAKSSVTMIVSIKLACNDKSWTKKK